MRKTLALAVLALIAAVVLIVACSYEEDERSTTTSDVGIGYYHDDEHGVSCWYLPDRSDQRAYAAISCLSDSGVKTRR